MLNRCDAFWACAALTFPKGWGSLAINTHRMNDIELIEKWDGPGGYEGKAVTAGAGVMTKDLYDQVWHVDQDVLAGECPVRVFPAYSVVLFPSWPNGTDRTRPLVLLAASSKEADMVRYRECMA